MSNRSSSRLRRKSSIRKKIVGTAERPRLSIFKSARYIYAQVIDDEKGQTMASCSTTEKAFREKLKSTRNLEAATAVGKELATRAKGKKVSKVVFDRNGYIYHGRVKALADAAREGGLSF